MYPASEMWHQAGSGRPQHDVRYTKTPGRDEVRYLEPEPDVLRAVHGAPSAITTRTESASIGRAQAFWLPWRTITVCDSRTVGPLAASPAWSPVERSGTPALCFLFLWFAPERCLPDRLVFA